MTSHTVLYQTPMNGVFLTVLFSHRLGAQRSRADKLN